MMYLLILLISVTSTVNFNKEDVLNSAKEVLDAREIPIRLNAENNTIEATIELNIEDIKNYVEENQPDDNPGWTKGRCSLSIKLSQTVENKTDITIDVHLERFGVRSAMLLIPPIWQPVPSNGELEKILQREIEEKLSIEDGRLR